jgi:transposase-like protein
MSHEIKYCPYCSTEKIREREKRRSYRCDICGKRFSVQFEGVDLK